MEDSITKKIQKSHDDIMTDPDGAGKAEARRLGDLAIKATLDGIKSRAWKVYMEQFTTEPKQLARLLGEDAFIKTEYGEECLAYIVANSTCTIETHKSNEFGTVHFLKTDVKEKLDLFE